jgi:hypothetical protein
MKTMAKQFGLLFQIADDFEDVKKDSLRHAKHLSVNYVIQKGYYDAYRDYTALGKQFYELSQKENVLTDELKQLVTYLNTKAQLYFNHDKDNLPY